MLKRMNGLVIILILILLFSFVHAQNNTDQKNISQDNIRLLVSNPSYGGQIYILLEVNGKIIEDNITVIRPDGTYDKIFLKKGQAIINATQIGEWIFVYKNTTEKIDINYKTYEIGRPTRDIQHVGYNNNIMYAFFVVLILAVSVLIFIAYDVSRSDIEFYKKYSNNMIKLTVKTKVNLRNIRIIDRLPEGIISSSLPDDILKSGKVEWEKDRIKKGEKVSFSYHVKYASTKPLKPATMIAEVDLEGKSYQLKLNSGIGIERISKHHGLKSIPTSTKDKKGKKQAGSKKKLRKLRRYVDV